MPTLLPQFRLFSAYIQPPADKTGQPTVDIAKMLAELRELVDKDAFPAEFQKEIKDQTATMPEWGPQPVGLRWSMIPGFGFPREAFSVFRRKQQYDNVIAWLTDVAILTNVLNFTFNDEDQYIIAVSATPDTGTTMTMEAMTHDGKVIPELTRQLSSGGVLFFKSPFIRGLRIQGLGTISQISSVRTSDVLNATGWELIQKVGLPFPKGMTAAYSDAPQGFIGVKTSPDRAAKQRLQMGEMLYQNPPPLNATLNSPDWTAPDPGKYLDKLINQPDQPLSMICECLENCDDSSWIAAKRQPAYFTKRILPGITQEGNPNTGDDVNAQIPVVATNLIAVSSDNFASLGLGYGTYDFIRTASSRLSATHVESARTSAGSSLTSGFDYLVTAPFTVRPSGDFEFPEFFKTFSELQIFGALSEELPLPLAPSDLKAKSEQINRPVYTDARATEAIRLSWLAPSFPQGYGLTSAIGSISPFWLNDQCDFPGKVYRPFLTCQPKNEIPNEFTGRFSFVESESPVPLNGVSHDQYFVAGLDVLGRWSQFTQSEHIAMAMQPQKPAITAVRLSLENPDLVFPPMPNTIPCTLDIEFSWESTDRRVAKIEFAGCFYHAALLPPDIPASGFYTNALNNPTHSIITVSFNSSGVPISDFGTVTLLTATDSSIPNLQKYRLVVNGITATFPNGSPNAVSYAVYGRALELVNVPTNLFSEYIGPVKSKLDDPRQPQVVILPATVQFTALPDATRKGRGHLSWASAGGAIGYHVYEASEVAIRSYIEPLVALETPAIDLLPLTDNHSLRATQLRDLLAIPKYASAAARAFSKYNKELLTETAVELEIPSGSEVLTVYRISSMNGSNIESDKSGPVFYAVPRLVKPAPPILMVKTVLAGIEITALNGAGPTPAGFRVYRIRKSLPSTDIGTKGLPVLKEDNSGWTSTVYTSLQGTLYPGKKIVDTIAVRNWKPYFYQVTGIGILDTEKGLLPGESKGSSTLQSYFPPLVPPQITIVGTLLSPPTVQFTTDIPFIAVELGRAILEVFELISSGVGESKSLLTSFFADDLTAGATAVANMTLLIPDSGSGITTLSLVLPSGILKGAIRITDPLRRSTEVRFEIT